MVEYKKLHNKLNWKLKSAQTDEDHTNAEQALKRLKTHREEMLQNFRLQSDFMLQGDFRLQSDFMLQGDFRLQSDFMLQGDFRLQVTSGSKAETEDLGPSGMPASWKKLSE